MQARRRDPETQLDSSPRTQISVDIRNCFIQETLVVVYMVYSNSTDEQNTIEYPNAMPHSSNPECIPHNPHC